MKKMQMKWTIVFLVFAFISCNANDNSGRDDEGTLRNTSRMLDSKNEWTQPLETLPAVKQKGKVDGISGSVSVNADNVFLSGKDSQFKGVFPRINGFTGIDDSLFDDEAYKIIKNVAEAFVENSSIEPYMSRDSIHALVVFKYDLDNMFGNAEFSSYVLGEPFKGNDFYECPLRLYFKSEIKSEKKRFDDELHLDLKFSMKKTDSTWRIFKIEFMQN